ncbi:hypothetical protein KR093_003194, partial [Drosophila rubida]
FLITTLLPAVMFMRKGEDATVILEGEEQRTNLLYQKDYQDMLEYLLPRMLHLGYFD